MVFFAGFWFGRLQVQAPVQNLDNTQIPAEIYVDLTIDYGSGNIQEFKDLSLSPKSSVYDLLKVAEKSNGLGLQVKDYGSDMGVLIEGLGGVSNNPRTGTYWQLWVNGSYAQVGASAYELNSGDKVEWKYTNSQIK